jgi:hypothetical protein
MNPKKSKRAVVKKALGPGVHVGVIELRSSASYRVRLLAGGHVRASLDEGLAGGFAQECMGQSRRVLLCDGPRGPVIVGAVDRSPGASPKDRIALSADRIELSAGRELLLRVGESLLRLDHTGALRLEGRTLVLDVASLVRFLSARVELP